jgi:hypothetical protein
VLASAPPRCHRSSSIYIYASLCVSSCSFRVCFICLCESGCGWLCSMSTGCRLVLLVALLLFLGASGSRPGRPPLRYADGAARSREALSPFVVRLRSAALRKTALSANDPAHHVARLVQVANGLPASEADDLVASINARYSARKRRLAVELVQAFAANGIVLVSAFLDSHLHSMSPRRLRLIG